MDIIIIEHGNGWSRYTDERGMIRATDAYWTAEDKTPFETLRVPAHREPTAIETARLKYPAPTRRQVVKHWKGAA